MVPRSTDNKGTIMVMVVYCIALFTAMMVGFLGVCTEDTLLLQNEVKYVESWYIAEAGLNDAYAQIKDNPYWNEGYSGKSLGKGDYTVNIYGYPPNLTVRSLGRCNQGYPVCMETDLYLSDVELPQIYILDMRIIR